MRPYIYTHTHTNTHTHTHTMEGRREGGGEKIGYLGGRCGHTCHCAWGPLGTTGVRVMVWRATGGRRGEEKRRVVDGNG